MLVNLQIAGGENWEQGPSAPSLLSGPDAVGAYTATVPWLNEIENCIFKLDGWFQKMPGASNVNGTATGATDAVMGVKDYWRSTASGAPQQQRMIYSGTQIYEESGGTLTSRLSGLEASMMPWFEVMNDVMLWASTSTVDVPRSWNGTAFSNLGGSPPNFAFMAEHKDRMFAGGVDTNKSRLYYSVLGNQADWTGAGSGSIDIAEDDGDVLTAIISHKNQLVLGKGPYTGSIYRLVGSSPTGADAFTLQEYIRRGVGMINQQSVVRWGDDLLFHDRNGFHSLNSTSAFGDYKETFLSRDIATYFTDRLNASRLNMMWGVNYVPGGYALWTASRAGATTHDVIIGWDYRFNPPRWFRWPAYAVASLAVVLDTSSRTRPWAGTYAGRVLRMDQAARNLAGTSYTGRALLPYLGFGDPFHDKGARKLRVGYQPKGGTTFTVGYQRDGNTQQTVSITQAGTATLGASSDQFTLDQDRLGGGRFLNAFADLAGQFKEVQLEVSQGTVDVDMEVHSLALEIEGEGFGPTATLG